jgi:hypothetical protein
VIFSKVSFVREGFTFGRMVSFQVKPYETVSFLSTATKKTSHPSGWGIFMVAGGIKQSKMQI